MIQSNPAHSISVVMSVYNGEKYLREAVESILAQSYRFSEFIIVNDATSDSSLEILESYRKKDRRITIINNPHNLGLGASLKEAIARAQGEFIARMDADDISAPDRFQKQVEYLEAHGEILVLGGKCKKIGEPEDGDIHFPVPKDPDLMRWNMLLGCGLIVHHGSVMIRRSLFDLIGPYSDARAAQDFELWTRLFAYDPLPIANLDEVIYHYRVHEQMVSRSQQSLQERNVMQIRKNKIEEFIGHAIPSELVPAYRHPGYAYIDIRNCVLTWIEVFEKLVKAFPLRKEMRLTICKELMHTVSKYVYFIPMSSRKGRVSLFKIIFSIPFAYTPYLLIQKMQYFWEKP